MSAAKDSTHSPTSRRSVYSGDAARVTLRGYKPSPTQVPFGTPVEGVHFDGYPQIVKHAATPPTYTVKKEKDLRVAVRDGVRLAVDVYRPDVEGEKFPALLAWGMWGKDTQEAIGWLADKPQAYYDTPFWDGTMEAGDYNYTVPRGYAHVIPDPRGIGDSEGYGTFSIWDTYDVIEWIAAQPWCNGKVGMLGPSSYSASQMHVAPLKPPHLVALHPDENMTGTGDYFHGIFDTLVYHILVGRHGNDSAWVYPNYAVLADAAFDAQSAGHRRATARSARASRHQVQQQVVLAPQISAQVPSGVRSAPRVVPAGALRSLQPGRHVPRHAERRRRHASHLRRHALGHALLHLVDFRDLGTRRNAGAQQEADRVPTRLSCTAVHRLPRRNPAVVRLLAQRHRHRNPRRTADQVVRHGDQQVALRE